MEMIEPYVLLQVVCVTGPWEIPWYILDPLGKYLYCMVMLLLLPTLYWTLFLYCNLFVF